MLQLVYVKKGQSILAKYRLILQIITFEEDKFFYTLFHCEEYLQLLFYSISSAVKKLYKEIKRFWFIGCRNMNISLIYGNMDLKSIINYIRKSNLQNEFYKNYKIFLFIKILIKKLMRIQF